MNRDNHIIFVYGTLMMGFYNNRILSNGNAVYLGHALTKDKYHMLHLGGFPGVIEANENYEKATQIWGEVFKVDDPTKDRMDALEGHPDFYKRTWVKAIPFFNSVPEIDVEMYIFQNDRMFGGSSHRVVSSGNWRLYNDN